MKKKSICALIVAACVMMAPSIYAAKQKAKSGRVGNTEIVESKNKGKVEYRLIYTYDGDKKVRGEYWVPVDPKNKSGNKSKSNIFAGTAIAKQYEKTIAESNVQDQSGIQVDIEKDGFILTSVKTVTYNKLGLPEHVSYRGYTSYPVAGTFNIKTDWDYSYDAAGKLSSVQERNLNLDSLLLNMAAQNMTKIERDQSDRPVKVTRTIGTIPPVFETTEYEYNGNTPDMKKTVYRKCGFDTTKLQVVPNETITTLYGLNVSWEGMRKYDLDMGKTVTGLSVYDEVNRKQLLDGSNFMKMTFIQKGVFAKNMYGFYKNEQKGPKWRMGELPDLPDPYLIYKDNVWYN
ncbi:MAG TPA: hypothetical protein VF857_04055 [Spirochaetota bacterium]